MPARFGRPFCLILRDDEARRLQAEFPKRSFEGKLPAEARHADGRPTDILRVTGYVAMTSLRIAVISSVDINSVAVPISAANCPFWSVFAEAMK
jgi:hypothetical protein